MPTDIVIKHFEGRPVHFQMEEERLTLTMREIGALLQYKYPLENVSKLYQDHKDEFDNDCTQIAVSAIQATVGRPPRRERIFTLEGLALICMFSEQPIAKKVRKWARRLMKEVWVTGSYNPAVSPQLLIAVQETLKAQSQMIQSLANEIHEVKEWKAKAFIPAPPDNSFWPTPTQRLIHLIPARDIPKGFNRGGSFDIYVSLRHAKIRGGLLSQRDRRAIRKLPDYVMQPCPENDQFLRETFKVYMEHEWPDQGKLKLVPEKLPRREVQPNA